jgi:hypothetical protein
MKTDTYGNVFERNGTIYVELDGGAILLSHASERSGGPIIVRLDGREAFIKPYGPSWWARATLANVRRIAVY